MKNMYLAVTFGILVLTGCNSNEYGGPDYSGVKAEIWGDINTPQTRYHGVEWGPGESIGVSVIKGDVGSTNVQYQFTGDKEHPFTAIGGDRNAIYIKGNGIAALTAYYPYSGINGINGMISINTNSENQTMANQALIDCLFAEATATRENPQVMFRFNHRLSQLCLNFEYENGSKPTDVSYTLKNIVTKGFFNTEDGKTELLETSSEETSNSEDINIDVMNPSMVSTLVLLPQEIAQATIEVIANGVFYSTTIDNITLENNKQHSYTVELGSDSSQITIKKNDTTEWQPGNGGEATSKPDAPDTDASFGSSQWGEGQEDQDIKSESESI